MSDLDTDAEVEAARWESHQPYWSVRLKDLYLHAFAYPTQRTLRLVRLRQQKLDDIALAGTFNLAALPSEIFDMILGKAKADSLKQARRNDSIVMPFCDCCQAKNIWRTKAVRPHFEEWCLRNKGEILPFLNGTDNEHRSGAHVEFEASSQCQGWLDIIRQAVATQGCSFCEDLWLSSWKAVAWNYEIYTTVTTHCIQKTILNMLRECGYTYIHLADLSRFTDEYDIDSASEGRILQNTRMALIGCNQGPVFDGVFLDEPDDLVDLCVHKEFAKGFRRCHRRSPLSHLLTLPATDLIRIAQVDKMEEVLAVTAKSGRPAKALSRIPEGPLRVWKAIHTESYIVDAYCFPLPTDDL